MFDLSLEDWVRRTGALLQVERDEEMGRTLEALSSNSIEDLEAAGSVLSRLQVLDITTGLFGRTMVQVGDAFGRALPAHRMTAGDIVGFRLAGSTKKAVAGTLASSAAVRESYDATGVVTRVDDKAVTVAIEDEEAGLSLGDKLRLDRIADDVTFQRLSSVLSDLKEYRHGPASRLFRLLFPSGVAPTAAAAALRQEEVVPSFWPEVPPLLPSHARSSYAASAAARAPSSVSSSASTGADGDTAGSGGYGFSPLRDDLNDSQQRAIAAALRARDLLMIHGPPGTGKTTTVVEYMRQEVARGRRVLACAGSNVAVDNMLERLAADNGSGAGAMRLVRLGHPARVTPALLAHSLDAQVTRADGSSIVADVRKELADVQKRGRTTRDKAVRRELRQEERRLKAEIRSREERVVTDIIRGADIVLATNTGAATKVLRKALATPAHGADGGGGAPPPSDGSIGRPFDVVVIDEVAQALEVSCFIPTLLGSKLVIAGDHCQLPPTIMSDAAAAGGLQLTLADRFVHMFNGTPPAPATAATATAQPTPALPVVHMLDVQYRMHRTISDWCSHEMYQDRLRPHDSVAGHSLKDLPHVAAKLAAAVSTGSGSSGDGTSSATDASASASATVVVSREEIARVRQAAAASAADAITSAKEQATGSSSNSGGGGGAGGGAGGGKGGGRSSAPSGPLIDVRTAAAVTAQAASAPSAAAALQLDLESLTAPLLLIDTAGCDMLELVDAKNESKSNVEEADVVVKHVLALLAMGLREKDIAVVTPYNAQVGLLRAMLHASHPGIEVRSVDGYQGQEKEAIVMSLVRSNEDRAVGFLADSRRMNVAVTRGRRHVAIVCDSDTVSADPFLGRLLDYMHAHGEVRTALDYEETVNTASGSDAFQQLGSGDTAGFSSRAKTRGNGGGATAAATGRSKGPTADDAAVKRRQEAKSILLSITRQLQAFIKAVEASATLDAVACSIPADGPIGALLTAAPVVVDGASIHLRYPPALTPLRRALVHKAATAAGLQHSSVGEGDARAISVTFAAAPQRVVAIAAAKAANAAARAIKPKRGALPAPTAATGNTATSAAASTTPLDQAGGAWVAMLADMHLSSDDDDDDDEAAVEVAAAESAVTVEAAAAEAEAEGADGEGAEEQDEAAATGAASANGGAAATSGGAGKRKRNKAKKTATNGSASAASGGSLLGSDAGSLVPGVKPPAGNSLLAQLHAERLARAPPPTPSLLLGAAAKRDDAPSIVVGTASSKQNKEKEKKPAAAAPPPVPAAASAASGGTGTPNTGLGADGVRREYGVRVEPVKPVPDLKATAKSSAEKKKGKGKGKSGGAGGGGAGDAAAEEEEDEEMALLDAVLAASRTCAVVGCKTSTTMTGTTCKHCNARFCYSHGLPEVHGCGGAARAEARGEWKGGAGMAAATGTARPTLPEWKRNAMANELHKKLDAAAAQRTVKKKDGKK